MSSISGYISNQFQQQVGGKSTITHNRKASPTSTTLENQSLFGILTTVNDSTPDLLLTEHHNSQKLKHSKNDKQEIINISRQQQRIISDKSTTAHDRRVSSTSTTHQNRYIFGNLDAGALSKFERRTTADVERSLAFAALRLVSWQQFACWGALSY